MSDSKGAAIQQILNEVRRDYAYPGAMPSDEYEEMLKSRFLAILAQEVNKAVVAELDSAHRAGGTTDYDNATDVYIDERLEQLAPKSNVGDKREKRI